MSLLRHLKRLALVLASILVLLALAEVAARLVAPYYSSHHLVPAVAADGTPVWIDNPFFAYRFAPPRIAMPPLPIVAAQERTGGSIRVVLLADDAGLGEPDPSFGIARILEAYLQTRAPGVPVEVIPLGLAGGNSHTLRESARDLGLLRPDAVVVLVGNNEIAGPFGPASPSGRLHSSSNIARLLTILSRTHLHQLYADLRNRWFPRQADHEAWTSAEPLTLRDRLQLDDPRLSAAHRSFAKNYAAILADALDATPVVLPVVPPVNLRDCAPFATAYVQDETKAQEVREIFRAAIKATGDGDLHAAYARYGELLERNPRHAEALYRAAGVALALGRLPDAAALYRRAADADALPLRATSTFQQAIRDLAAENGLGLCDGDALFCAASADGIPGHDLFLDHIHYAFPAACLLAADILRALQDAPAFAARLTAPGAPLPPREDLAAHLLQNPWGELSVADTLLRQQLSQPFLRQTTHTNTLAHLHAVRDAAQARVDAIPPLQTRAIFARRKEARPDDIYLSGRAAQYLLRAGDAPRAETAARNALALAPHRYDLRALLAFILSAQGTPFDEVLPVLRSPDARDGYFHIRYALNVAASLENAGHHAQAAEWARYILAQDPCNSGAAIQLSRALYQMGEFDASIAVLNTATEAVPENPLVWEELCSVYCLTHDWNASTKALNRAESIAPYRYTRLLKLAQAMARLHQYKRAHNALARYLSVVPEDPDALALQDELADKLPPDPDPAATDPKPDAAPAGLKFF